MNFLSIFVLIPLLMLAGLWVSTRISKPIRGVSGYWRIRPLLIGVRLYYTLVEYLGERSCRKHGRQCCLPIADMLWYAPLHIFTIQ